MLSFTASTRMRYTEMNYLETQLALKESYARFVPEELTHHLEKESILHVELGDQQSMDMSILFTDIRDFTSISESLSPEENFEWVNNYLAVMVPVVRNAENMSFSDIENEIKTLAIRAREGKITVDEMTGGTFTISNGGVFGSMLSTPIINPPQSGILGMHNIMQRPVAVDGKVEIRPIMYIALSYDHRIIDGKESVSFLMAVKEALEDPINLLMDGNVKKALGM